MKKKIRIYTIHSEDPVVIREELMMNFPAFIADCMNHKETFQLKYSELGNARFERDYGFNLKDWVAMAFFKDPNRTKHTPRKLSISKSDDS